jgi:hypothetical protein
MNFSFQMLFLLVVAFTTMLPAAFCRADQFDKMRDYRMSPSDQGLDPQGIALFKPKYYMSWAACNKSCEDVQAGPTRNNCVRNCTDFDDDE